MSAFIKATKKRSKARIAIDGPAGAGKTYTALIAAKVLSGSGKFAVVDTERGSASLYSDQFEFDVLELDTFHPQKYIDAIKSAEKEGYSVLVIDSLSHAWEGKDGARELHDKAVDRQRTKNEWTAWRDVTPLHNQMVDAILQSNMHIICTMRSKMDYVQERDGDGKTVVKKIGLAPIQRPGMEYEFTLVCDMDIDHKLIVSKSRCAAIDSQVVNKPGVSFWEILNDWLNSGEAYTPPVIDPRSKFSPQLLGRWDAVVEKAKAAGLELHYEITKDDTEETLLRRGVEIKAATTEKLGVLNGGNPL